jgi:thiamine biosynthesis lipoprotein
MLKSRKIMGMACTVRIEEPTVHPQIFDNVFNYWRRVDRIFSTYKPNSEISRINRGELSVADASKEVQNILRMARETRLLTRGYFNVVHQGKIDPSGLVKGWAITGGANILRHAGYRNFLVEIAGDLEVSGGGPDGSGWKIGLRHPFELDKYVKIVKLKKNGVATSGAYLQGDHIYNPVANKVPSGVASITVIGPSAYDADRFATAIYAAGKKGLKLLPGGANLEGYLIDSNGVATYTAGFEKYVV